MGWITLIGLIRLNCNLLGRVRLGPRTTFFHSMDPRPPPEFGESRFLRPSHNSSILPKDIFLCYNVVFFHIPKSAVSTCDTEGMFWFIGAQSSPQSAGVDICLAKIFVHSESDEQAGPGRRGQSHIRISFFLRVGMSGSWHRPPTRPLRRRAGRCARGRSPTAFLLCGGCHGFARNKICSTYSVLCAERLLRFGSPKKTSDKIRVGGNTPLTLRIR